MFLGVVVERIVALALRQPGFSAVHDFFFLLSSADPVRMCHHRRLLGVAQGLHQAVE